MASPRRRGLRVGVVLLVLLYLRDAEAQDRDDAPEQREEAGETSGG